VDPETVLAGREKVRQGLEGVPGSRGRDLLVASGSQVALKAGRKPGSASKLEFYSKNCQKKEEGLERAGWQGLLSPHACRR